MVWLQGILILNIITSHRDQNVISAKLGKVLENWSYWLVDNKLSLHLGKTEGVLFGPSRKLKSEGQFEVKCHNDVIKASDHVKYLGVTIDKYLRCDLIVNEIIKKVNARFKFQLTKDQLLVHHINTLTKIDVKIDKCELP